MCHPKLPKNINSQESVIPDDLSKITDIPSHNEPNINGYIITINRHVLVELAKGMVDGLNTFLM